MYQSPTLYIIATPIGNLGDITYRAIDTLKSADLIICEDTRQTKKLLNHYGIENKRLAVFNAQSTEKTAEKILDKLASVKISKCESKKRKMDKSGPLDKGDLGVSETISTPSKTKIAFVSDAGTPGISDPGYRLLQVALKHNFMIVPLPGPSALTTLVSVAGVPVDKFQFLGFLPHKKGRQTILKSIQDKDQAVIFYESVHRFPRLLSELAEFVGQDRTIVVGRELTKMHEEVFRGTVNQAVEHFTDENTRGEFVVIVAGKKFR